MKLEASRGVLSTFFFATRAAFDANGHPLDVGYDARSPRFRRLFRRVRSGGWGVGLHASYNARENLSFFREERDRLEQASGGPVLGNRHHYWHMHRELVRTFRMHEEAGLVFDSSVAFEESPGYRLGIAFPFHPWDAERSRASRCLEIPVMVMDGAYFDDPRARVDEAVSRFATLLAALKRAEGVAAIDWHEYTSHPRAGQFSKWGEGYAAILDLLTSDSEVDVVQPDEVYFARGA
jgi:hypothetical protein